MRSFASRIRVTPVVAIAALLAVAAVLVGLVLAGLSSNYSDGHVKVAQLTSNDLADVASKTYLIDCSHQPVVRPRIYTLTCGDANIALDPVTWTSGWGGPEARGTGTYVENTCEPYCAAGHDIYLPVTVVAHGLERKSGTAIYTSITVTFTKKAPSWVHGHSTTFDVTPIG